MIMSFIPKMTARYSKQSKQQGIAMVSSLVILLLMTVVALSVVRGNSLFEKIAGNTREKQRALQSAQDAILYAEWWLWQSGNYTTASNPVSCGTAITSMKVCLADAGTSISSTNGLPFYKGYVPPNMVVSANCAGNTVTTGGDVQYCSAPGIYINTLPAVNNKLAFRITAIGYGGSSGANKTQAVVQSIYVLGNATNSNTNLD